jgi:hypothetical protein
MQLLQATLTGAAVPIVASRDTSMGPSWQFLLVQNNTAGAITVGDATVSASKGIKIAAGAAQPFWNPLEYANDLSEWYVFGASGVVDIMLLR